MIRCMTTKCFIHRHFVLSVSLVSCPNTNGMFGFQVYSFHMLAWFLLVSGSSVFAVVKPSDQQPLCFWVGLEYLGIRLSSADRIRIVDGATDCYVRSPSWNFSLGWRSRLVAQAAQDFTQSKMMHPAVGKAKTGTGRRVVWAQVSVGRYMLYTVHLCMCSCIIMACWDCTWLYCRSAIVFLFVTVDQVDVLHIFVGALELWRWHWQFRLQCISCTVRCLLCRCTA